MRNVSEVAGKIKTHILCSRTFNFSKIMPWKNPVEPNRSQITIRRMHFARWIPKATNTHSEYLILIAFPLQQWLHERASMLRYTYSACLVESPLRKEKRIRVRRTTRHYDQLPTRTDTNRNSRFPSRQYLKRLIRVFIGE